MSAFFPDQLDGLFATCSGDGTPDDKYPNDANSAVAQLISQERVKKKSFKLGKDTF